jgi:GH15 family glucan-1,4-alpha-glucosidase
MKMTRAVPCVTTVAVIAAFVASPAAASLASSAAGARSLAATAAAKALGPTNVPATCTSSPCTPASSTSTTSQLFNNWNDLIGVAQSAKLAPKDVTPYGPTLAELHYKGDWPMNQIQSEAAYLSPATNADQRPPSGQSQLAFDRGGVLHQNYGDNYGVHLPVLVHKSYIAVPHQPFFILSYRLINRTHSSQTFNFMDNVELNNKQWCQENDTNGSSGGTSGGSGSGGGSGLACIIAPTPNQPDAKVQSQAATYNAAHRGWDVDMTASGGFYFSQGAFQSNESHGAGTYIDGPFTPGDAFQTTVMDFRGSGHLSNNNSFTGQIVTLGLQRHVTLSAKGSTTLSFVLTVQGSAAAAQSAVATALSRSASAWASREQAVYLGWLNSGARSTQADQGARNAFDISLVTLKQSQQPQFGSWVAATNPAYLYKVWPRDASVTAIAMDAAGHLPEAEKYWRWEASVQNTTSPPNSGLSPGTWYTNYSFWAANTPIPFVQPELDSTGLFIVGVYKHFLLLDATNHAAALAFVNVPEIKAAIELGANFVVNGIDPTLGFGPQDQSIWEERFEFATFTQATYTAGLLAAAKLAPMIGDASMAASWMTGSTTIRAAILRPTNTPGKPGLWYNPGAAGNPPIGCVVTPTFHGPNCNGPYPSTGDKHPFFARGIFDGGGETPDNNPMISVDSEVDSSTGVLWVLGVIDANSVQAVDQRNKINRWLGKGMFGISRHENDDFYFSSVYSPGGQYEAQAMNPIWPQPVMYMSMLNTWQGQFGTGKARLSWYAGVSPYGYEPPGEAVDWTNMQPLLSTASEPVTGAWFMLATLTAQHQYDTRLTGYGS